MMRVGVLGCFHFPPKLREFIHVEVHVEDSSALFGGSEDHVVSKHKRDEGQTNSLLTIATICIDIASPLIFVPAK